MAIDAALGDSEAAKNLFSKDTFLTALESGPLRRCVRRVGGAAASGAGKAERRRRSLLGQTEHNQMDRMKRPLPSRRSGRPGQRSPSAGR